MRFELTEEQRGFDRSLDELLADADTPAAARAWADGDASSGLKLWGRIADLGVTGLFVPVEHGGLDASAVDLAVALEALGRHAVPGPWVESTAFLPVLLAGVRPDRLPDGCLRGLVEGGVVASVAAPPWTPYALDGHVATHVFAVQDAEVHLAEPVAPRRSVDPTRRLSTLRLTHAVGAVDTAVVGRARDTAALACAAHLVGLGERLLSLAVDYAKVRRQFGRPIGQYQALKHALADVRVALDFARPLLYGAALTLDAGSRHAARDVSAAKVAANEAAYLAARTALQVHGAIGYTAEHDLGLWILKVRALVGAWGTSSAHRARVLAALEREA